MSVRELTKTARTKGAVGPHATVPRLVVGIHPRGGSVLDYGAGPKAIHSEMLRSFGFIVTAYDIGENFNPEVHDKNALNNTYDIVMASNVINVQTSAKDIIKVIWELKNACKDNGLVIFNYPKEPRKLIFSKAEEAIEEGLALQFSRWFKVGQIYFALQPYKYKGQ